MRAKLFGIVKGSDVDGTFAPTRQINKAEFLKMLLMANFVKEEALEAAENTAASRYARVPPGMRRVDGPRR